MTDSNAPLLHSRCLIADGSSLLTSAYLYPTHIEIKGWTWSGRVSRRISLHEVTQIRWWAGVNGKSKRRLLPVNLELTLEDTRFFIYLHEKSGIWYYTLRRLCKTDISVPEGID